MLAVACFVVAGLLVAFTLYDLHRGLVRQAYHQGAADGLREARQILTRDYDRL